MLTVFGFSASPSPSWDNKIQTNDQSSRKEEVQGNMMERNEHRAKESVEMGPNPSCHRNYSSDLGWATQTPQRLGIFSFYINLFIYLFIFGCIGSLLLHVGFLWLQRAGATLPCSAQVSHCGGFTCCGAQALGTRASVVVAHSLSSCGSRALEHRLSSCGTRA